MCRCCASAGPVEGDSPAPIRTRRWPRGGRAGARRHAQERTSSWHGFVDDSHHAHRPGHPRIAWRRQSSMPDHWYFYFADGEWGPAFIKLCSYAPYPLWCCANGHEWAKRQLTKAGIGFQASQQVARRRYPAVAHRFCARFGVCHVRDLLRRMMAVMPDPLTVEDRRSGFDWSFSIAQLEVSDTALLYQPRRARPGSKPPSANTSTLGVPRRSPSSSTDGGQPGQVQDARTLRHRGHRPRRRPAAADPLQVLQAKAYLKEGRALRVETTLNNATDFDLHKTLNAGNWRALRRVGADPCRFLAPSAKGRPPCPIPPLLRSVLTPAGRRRSDRR